MPGSGICLQRTFNVERPKPIIAMGRLFPMTSHDRKTGRIACDCPLLSKFIGLSVQLPPLRPEAEFANPHGRTAISWKARSHLKGYLLSEVRAPDVGFTFQIDMSRDESLGTYK